jgi:hypothetical protein
MLSMKDGYKKKMKTILGPSFSYELLHLMFTLPYLKIELIQKKGFAHRQMASTWLKKLADADADVVKPHKIGRTTYYINHRLMELLSAD